MRRTQRRKPASLRRRRRSNKSIYSNKCSTGINHATSGSGGLHRKSASTSIRFVKNLSANALERSPHLRSFRQAFQQLWLLDYRPLMQMLAGLTTAPETSSAALLLATLAASQLKDPAPHVLIDFDAHAN
jgi:hypothetical protein